MIYFNPKFGWSRNLSFFGLGPWAIYNPWYLAEIGKFCNLLKMNIDVIPFETSHCKLSENQKIVEFGSTEFKLWQLKECPKPM